MAFTGTGCKTGIAGISFYPAFILFLILVLLVFGAGFLGWGGIGLEA
jgi:ABC-type Co2+ transport system permease subunit